MNTRYLSICLIFIHFCIEFQVRKSHLKSPTLPGRNYNLYADMSAKKSGTHNYNNDEVRADGSVNKTLGFNTGTVHFPFPIHSQRWFLLTWPRRFLHQVVITSTTTAAVPDPAAAAVTGVLVLCLWQKSFGYSRLFIDHEFNFNLYTEACDFLS